MFTLKKIITPFFLPPGIFVVLLCVSGIWLVRRKCGKAGLLNLMLALLLWLCSSGPVANGLMAGLERGQEIPASLTGDVIILLGGGIHENVADLTGRGAPRDDALARLVTAARAQKRLGVPVIVSGGAWSEGGTPEATILRRFLVDLGVPEKKIVVEARSRDTAENALYSKEICVLRGFGHPLLVTSAYHMPRALYAFRTQAMPVHPLPASFKASRNGKYGWMDCLPSSGALNLVSTALHEYVGLLYYRLMF